MGSFGVFEWLIIIVILVVLFAGKRLPKLIRGVGQGIIEFKKASRDENETDKEKDNP